MEHQNTVLALTAEGSEAEEPDAVYEYSPYGEQTSETLEDTRAGELNPFGYTGAYQFQDGTVHLYHRFLGTFTLNFTQPDPSRQELNKTTPMLNSTPSTRWNPRDSLLSVVLPLRPALSWGLLASCVIIHLVYSSDSTSSGRARPGTMVAMPSGLETASREKLLALIGVLQDRNTLLREQVAHLQADNERLTARVGELECRLGRNSGNSSLLLPLTGSRSRTRNQPPRAPASADEKGR